MNPDRDTGASLARHRVRVVRKRLGSFVRRFRSRGLAFPIEVEERQGANRLAGISASISSADRWRLHAERVRGGVLHSAGLVPMPVKTDLRPIFDRRREFGSHSVENVAFESFPGFFVTANLYRPLPLDSHPNGGRVPLAGVLAPHGHTRRRRGPLRGRFSRELQTLCSSLARMGSVVLAYDMVGWGESSQLSHRSAANVLGLQLWNSIRAIDFLESLPEVDPRRIGMAGFSGGATQTFLAAAVDERVAAFALVAQLSSHFFGGCSCERGITVDGDPVGPTNNVEIAAVGAPRPQLLVSTGWDWSRNTPAVEYPFLRHVYGTLGATDCVENLHLPDEGHDYGFTKRRAVYRFLADRLGLELHALERQDGEIGESETVICERKSLCIFDETHPRPAHALNGAAAVQVAFEGLARSASGRD